MPKVPTESDVLELAYLYGLDATYLPGETFGPRELRDYELVWIEQGSAVYQHDGQTLHAPEGSVLLTRPGFREHYAWDAHQATRHAFMHFDIVTMPSDWPPPDDWPVVRVLPPGDVVISLFRHSLSWCRSKLNDRTAPPRSVTRMIEALISAYLSQQIEPADRGQQVRSDTVQGVLDWVAKALDDQPDCQITLHDLADAGSVSEKHLIRLFNDSLHMTPMRVVRLVRLSRAMALLVRSNLTIKQIAARCGFASQYHFSRTFTEAYRNPPSVVREKVRAGEVPPTGPLALNPFFMRSDAQHP